MNVKSIGYWVITAILVFAMFSGGVAEVIQREETIAGMVQLGYPPYFVMILGFWKVLGSIVLLAPRLPRLKEWAYAGIFFNMSGAVISHIVSGSTPDHVVWTSFFALCTLASWALRPASRVLGASSPVGVLA